MAPETGKPVILAVDDDPDTLGMLSGILEAANLTALVARDGKKALALLDHALPDLILMDAMMPQMDGFEATRTLKSRAAFAHIPVIFMTGLSDTDSVVRGFESGGVDYVTKPIRPAELVARLRAHLAGARLTRSAHQALDASGPPLMSVTAQGGINWVTPRGLELLGAVAHAPDWRLALAPMLRGLVESRLEDGLVHQSLHAVLIGEARPGEYLIRLKDANAPREDRILKDHFALTDREAEVLMWVAKGKSNRDVAEILDCSPRTVTKHLEQIYQKLDVENRTAAAMRAVHVLGS